MKNPTSADAPRRRHQWAARPQWNAFAATAFQICGDCATSIARDVNRLEGIHA
jgi:hypothetical protein